MIQYKNICHVRRYLNFHDAPRKHFYYAVMRFADFLATSFVGICASFDCPACLNVSALPTLGLKVIENGFDGVLYFSVTEMRQLMLDIVLLHLRLQ